MDIDQELSVEQQFELKVFETQVQQLSQQDAQMLLVQLRSTMMQQTTYFREMLKEAWGIEKGIEVLQDFSQN